MEWFLAAILLFYTIMLMILLRGWQVSVGHLDTGNAISDNLISIVISVRNEANHIVALLDSLDKQADDHFEVIIVNDHSSDRTVELALNQIRSNSLKTKRLIHLQDVYGKKNSINAGIEEAQGNIIATLDADCKVGPEWLSSLREKFTNPTVQFVFGMVRIKEDPSLWTSMQVIEFASLIGTGAATFGWGIPTMCNGANLAFRKNAFYTVDGYSGNEHIPSGDDEFLYHKIFGHYGGGVVFNSDQRNVVTTEPQLKLADFIEQRKRWAGKWDLHKSPWSASIAVFVFIFHVFFIISLGIMVYSPVSIVSIGIVMKVAVEAIFLRRVVIRMGNGWNWWAFLVLQVTYSWYVVSVGLMANISGYTWKGRQVSRLGHQSDTVLAKKH